jgi:hypothetical protein
MTLYFMASIFGEVTVLVESSPESTVNQLLSIYQPICFEGL